MPPDPTPTIPPPGLARYQRQMLLPQIGRGGQEKLVSSRVLLIGCGALGSVLADQLARAGVGHLTIADRDIVEWTNLQRQVLFDEDDAKNARPKAVAAARRLAAVNSQITVEPVATDVHSGNIESLAATAHLILDGTDNVETRYLVNDLAVKTGKPWIYGACVAWEGRVMTIPATPGAPCLRCLFPTPPPRASLPTCDTAGVLGPAASVVASLQSAAAIKLLTGHAPSPDLLSLDLFTHRFKTITPDKDPDCPCCAKRHFEFLNAPPSDSAATLCGRNAIQVRGAKNQHLDLSVLARKWRSLPSIEESRYFLRAHLDDGLLLTAFPDGRLLVSGTSDPARARSLYARYIGG